MVNSGKKINSSHRLVKITAFAKAIAASGMQLISSINASQNNSAGNKNNAKRAITHNVNKNANLLPFKPSYPAQFCTAVSKKPRMIAPEKPNNIL